MTRVGINVDRNWETELFDSAFEAMVLMGGMEWVRVGVVCDFYLI